MIDSLNENNSEVYNRLVSLQYDLGNCWEALVMKKHRWDTYIIKLDTCTCCGSEITEICGECIESICYACHDHYLLNNEILGV